jgi:hypothetical protein
MFPTLKILRRVNEPCGVWKKYLVGKFQDNFSPNPASLPGAYAGYCQRAVVDEMGINIIQMGNAHISNGCSTWDALCDTAP